MDMLNMGLDYPFGSLKLIGPFSNDEICMGDKRNILSGIEWWIFEPITFQHVIRAV